MEWVRAHPYTSAVFAAMFLLLCGVIFVQRQGSATPSSRAGAWDGANLGVLDPTAYAPSEKTGPSREDILKQVQGNAPYSYIPPSVTNPEEGSTNSDSFDLNSFIAILGQGTTAKPKPTGDSSPQDAYAFIPTGLMSTTTSQSTRTDTQQKIYDYGNDIGSYIQSFEEQHPTMSFTLKDQAEDRTDPQKAAAVEELGQALAEVGHNISSIEDIPSGMTSAHDSLGKSYIAIGTNLALIARAHNDADFIHAIEVYNASADTFVKNYVGLATLFGAYGVIFGATDAGSVFTFTPRNL